MTGSTKNVQKIVEVIANCNEEQEISKKVLKLYEIIYPSRRLWKVMYKTIAKLDTNEVHVTYFVTLLAILQSSES